MDRAIKFTQAYYQTPWRKQLQRIGLFLVFLVVCALVAGVYLSVNSRAASIGRQIQYDRDLIDKLDKQIADQQSQVAILTSAAEMEKRADEMGFHSVNSDEILYLVVEGYNGRTPAVLAVESKAFVPATSPTLAPEFTQSLFDWVQIELSLPSDIFWKNMP
jgi:cell division protein FtsL